MYSDSCAQDFRNQQSTIHRFCPLPLQSFIRRIKLSFFNPPWACPRAVMWISLSMRNTEWRCQAEFAEFQKKIIQIRSIELKLKLMGMEVGRSREYFHYFPTKLSLAKVFTSPLKSLTASLLFPDYVSQLLEPVFLRRSFLALPLSPCICLWRFFLYFIWNESENHFMDLGNNRSEFGSIPTESSRRLSMLRRMYLWLDLPG